MEDEYKNRVKGMRILYILNRVCAMMIIQNAQLKIENNLLYIK
jgi:hypothetical protein